ncbi:alpha/beta hydrolase [Acholeplasma granularum]|uniref:alpha/beta hydrolase n=1 Tax=Acholeplasma granularum TaxID=264635 RepID=UPI00046E7CE0|nr:alpha/beta hydrolase [Acholeplasma granularum]
MIKLQLATDNYVELYFMDDKKRPFVLIAPGGGYNHTSPREALPIVEAFHENGFHAGIIYYRQTHLKHPDTTDELAQFVDLIKSNLEYPILKDQFVLCGFSSGGHYMASLGVMHQNYKINAKPDALVLAYPVITGKENFAHEGSITRLYSTINDDTRKDFSLELKVTEKMPPTFLFHTVDDQSVKVENSLFLFNALRKYNCTVDAHFYHSGQHGLSLGTKAVLRDEFKSNPEGYEKLHSHNQTWFKLAISFFNKIFE